ncbi:MAG: hypothetical protein KH216_13070, partial [Clostridiales bacterium]|nr:hypothetical protein [Clostridiales bacterium]
MRDISSVAPWLYRVLVHKLSKRFLHFLLPSNAQPGRTKRRNKKAPLRKTERCHAYEIYPSMLMRMPAATAEPMTPATLGP